MKSFLFHSLIFICIVQKVNGQTFQLGTWNILNLTYSHNENVSFFGEGQLRSLKFYTHFHYYEFKGGISYRVHKNVKLTLGAGSYQTYKEGGNFILPKNNDEFRIWPQLALSQPIGKLKIEQRYRAELRFTSNGYRNRFRYRLGVSYAFGKERDEYKPYQASISNELFFTTTEPYFERNRILVALNYKPSKNTMLQLGYLHQFDYKITDEIGLNFFQIGYFIECSRKKITRTLIDMDSKDN